MGFAQPSLQDILTSLHDATLQLAKVPLPSPTSDLVREYLSAVQDYSDGLQVLPRHRAKALEANVSHRLVEHVASAHAALNRYDSDGALERVYSAINALPGEPGLKPRKVPRPTPRD